MQQGPRDSHSLLHSMAQAFHIPVLHVGRIGNLHHLRNPLFPDATPQAKGGSEEVEVLSNPHVLIGAEFIRHISDQLFDPPHVLRAIGPGDKSFAGRRARKANKHFDRRGLTGAVRTNKPKNLTTRDRQSQVIQGDKLAVVLTEIHGFNHWLFIHNLTRHLFLNGIRQPTAKEFCRSFQF